MLNTSPLQSTIDNLIAHFTWVQEMNGGGGNELGARRAEQLDINGTAVFRILRGHISVQQLTVPSLVARFYSQLNT